MLIWTISLTDFYSKEITLVVQLSTAWGAWAPRGPQTTDPANQLQLRPRGQQKAQRQVDQQPMGTHPQGPPRSGSPTSPILPGHPEASSGWRNIPEEPNIFPLETEQQLLGFNAFRPFPGFSVKEQKEVGRKSW